MKRGSICATRGATRWALVAAVAVALGSPPALSGLQLRYDREYPTIDYASEASSDRVIRLWERVEAGDVALAHQGPQGYLAALLEALDISTTSQILVFTRTSFQANLISPQKPRAIYFNDDAFVAWVQDSDVIEISAIDPVKGGLFYSLGQEPDEPDAFARETDLCLQCHDSYGLSGGGVPRHLVGSMVPDENGQSVYHEGWQLTDDRTPIARRWGGWYVTGTHGDLIHRGNAIVEAPATPDDLDFRTTGNRTDLEGLVDTTPYLSGHSDIVALMVLEHQVRVQNAITRVGYDVRTSLHRDETDARPVGSGESRASAETIELARRVAEPLVEALLFVDEAPLRSTVEGTSGFAEDFEARGERDSRGRSLRDLDLRRRLFRYPVSYMIYTAAFDGLPAEAKRVVVRRLERVLAGEDDSGRFDHIDASDRVAALEILRETKSDLFGR